MKKKFKSEPIMITNNNQVIGKLSSKNDIMDAVKRSFIAAGIPCINPEDIRIEREVTPVKCAGNLKYQCIVNWYVDYSDIRQAI